MTEYTYAAIADGYLRETSDPGYCSVIARLIALGKVAGQATVNGFRALEAL